MGSKRMTHNRRKRLLSNKLLIDIFGDSSDAVEVIDQAFKEIEKKTNWMNESYPYLVDRARRLSRSTVSGVVRRYRQFFLYEVRLPRKGEPSYK
jgi:hypothetical protein